MELRTRRAGWNGSIVPDSERADHDLHALKPAETSSAEHLGSLWDVAYKVSLYWSWNHGEKTFEDELEASSWPWPPALTRQGHSQLRRNWKPVKVP